MNESQLKLLANTIRLLSADAVEKAKSGHPGLPLGAADYAGLLWANHLRFNPQNPDWVGRDRFVLSAGHGCMLLYSLLHLFGYEVSLADLQRFRQWGSKTPGHPEYGVTPGVETTTGPLGQGFANGVGLALSAKLLAHEYDQALFGYRVFGIVSDGDLMEGVAAEAASLAGHLGLGNLIYIYDDNHISIGGSTEVCFSESVPRRFEAYGWQVQTVDGYDLTAVERCISNAVAEANRPSLICARSIIGFGSPNRAGDAEVHGAPLGEAELKLTKKNLGADPELYFAVPEQVRGACAECVERKLSDYQNWQEKFAAWQSSKPSKASAWEAQAQRRIPSELKPALLGTFSDSKKEATRSLSGKAIQTIAKHVPWFVGGSADLEPSTKTLIKASAEVQAEAFGGRNLRFGVREHGMGAIANGLAYTRCWIPYTATFLVFSDYMRPPIRLAALSHLQTLFLFTHDSFQVGEDGPTHQPIEQIGALRLIPNLHVYRPADGVEVAMCYYSALTRRDGPSVLLFTRQDVPPLARPAGFDADAVLRGAYVVSGAGNEGIVLVATGSEVWLAVAAAELLATQGILARVISMPCMELFMRLTTSERDALLPRGAKLISLEAGVTTGWERIVGRCGLKIGIDHFGASAPAGDLAEEYGFTPEKVCQRVLNWLKG